MFDQAAERWPYFYMTLSFAYLGLMRAIMDETAAYLIGDGGPGVAPPKRIRSSSRAGPR